MALVSRISLAKVILSGYRAKSRRVRRDFDLTFRLYIRGVHILVSFFLLSRRMFQEEVAGFPTSQLRPPSAKCTQHEHYHRQGGACYRRHAAAACCSLVCSSGQRNSKFLYYDLYIFLAGLVELEKENKFHYGVATWLLPVHTQPPPPCRGSPALSVGAWGA